MFSTALAFVGLFRMLPDLGMAYASTLDISRDPRVAQRTVGGLLGLQAVLSALTLLLCYTLGAFTYEGVTLLAVIVLAPDVVLKSLKFTLRFALKALGRFGTEAASLVFERVLLLGLALFALLAGYGVLGLALAFLVARAADFAALCGFVHSRVLPLVPHRDPGLWRELLRKGLPFAYANAMVTLIFQIDVVMLEKMRGVHDVGIYRAPVNVLEGLTLVPRILGYAVIPTMAALHVQQPGKIAELYRRGLKYLLLAGLPVGVFGLLESQRFVRLLFGTGFDPSAAVAPILLGAAAFMFLSNFAETSLACIDRWRVIVVVSTVALVLNVTLNAFWIPRWGYLGAAFATLATELAYFALSARAMHRLGHRVDWLSLLVKPALATLVFALVLRAAGGLPLIAAAAAASAAFVAATFALRVWDAEERRLLAGLLRRHAGPTPPLA